MNANRLIRMLVNRVLGRAMAKGVDALARGGRAEEELTPDQRARAKRLSSGAKQARKAARMARRMGRL